MLIHRTGTATVSILGGLALALGTLGPAAVAAASASTKPTVSKNPPLVSLQKLSSPRVGSVLVAPLDGTGASLWSGSPKLSLQWYRCATSTMCREIPGATKDDYTVVTADIDDFLQAWVTATNSSGSTVEKSPLSALIRNPLVPVNSKLPEISPAGIAPLPGIGLHAATGSWTGSLTRFVFQWLLCTSADKCAVVQEGVVSLPTSSTLITSGGELGDTIKVEVAAVNKYGSSPYATSLPTKPVAI